MNCYGKYSNSNTKCRSCSYKKYCQEAGDIAPLSSVTDNVDCSLYAHERKTISGNNNEERRYSRNDLLEVIGFLLAMDDSTLRFLDEYFQDPTQSFSSVANKRKQSRQAVSQLVMRRCRRIPELREVILKRQSIQRNNSKTTFMEAVCRIKRQMSEMKSKQQKNGSSYSKSLSCLNQSFDLSKMSIIKGGNNWKGASHT